MDTAGSAVCDADSVLAEDAAVAGVGYPADVPELDELDGVEIVGCVEVDFGVVGLAQELRIVAAGVQGTCGSTCGDSCDYVEACLFE